MKYRKLDNNGDYVFGGGLSDFLIDKLALEQAIKTKINLFMGEWWEDLEQGLPMFQSILGASGNQKTNIDLMVQQRLLSIANVKTIKSFNSSLANRNYSFYCVVDSIFGVLPVSLPNVSGSTT